MLPISLVVCLLGPTNWLPASVAPAAKPGIAIAPIVYSTTIPAHTRDAVHATVIEAVQDLARNALLLDVDAECRTRECALRQARDAQAEFLLELVITVDQRDFAIEIVVLAVADGRQLTEASGQCRLCAQAELLSAIAAQLASLELAIERASIPRVVEQPSEPAPPRLELAPTQVRARTMTSV